MADKQSRGVKGILGGLLTPTETAPSREPSLALHSAQATAPELRENPEETPQPENQVPVVTNPARAAGATAKARGARKGRPPGSKNGAAENKVKKTFAIDQGLYDACVSRSWKEEVQVWELIEQGATPT